MDEAALTKFVNEAALLIEDELEAIACSTAYEGFNGYGLDVEEESEDVSLVTSVEVEEGCLVGDLSWTAHGSSLVASEVQDHSSWCSHVETRLVVYRVGREGEMEGEPQVFNTPSCCTAVQAHPTDSQVVAAGCHTGEVLIFRLDREGETLSSGQGDTQTDSHNPVTAILWITRNSLVSTHSTGFIRIYSIDYRKSQLVLQKVG